MSNVSPTRRWRGVIAFAFASGAIGILANRADLFLLAVVGIVFATYPTVLPPPSVELTLDRRLGTSNPSHGESVVVTVTITNRGNRTLPDLRVVDGVPAALRVTNGSPRRGMALTPGKSSTFSYTIEAKHGDHTFEPTTVVARDWSGAQEIETTLTTETVIHCTSEIADISLRNRTQAFTGRIEANRGGSGIEFHRTRDYQFGDPMNQIDWNRYARTGDLTTVEFDEEQAVTVMLVIDARSSAYRGRPDHPHAVAYCVSAASQLLDLLHQRHNWVGIAGLGHESCWLEPGSGVDHIDDADRLLRSTALASSLSSTERSHDSRSLDAIRDRLPDTAQVVLFSPLCDDDIVELALKLNADGNQVTVISPDVTGTESVGERLSVIERLNRLSTLRRGDVVVFEWGEDDELSTILAGQRSVIEQ